MSQKRVLVIGAILVAAGIGAPTTAFLAPGGVLSEPREPQAEAPAHAPAEPHEVSPDTPAGIAPRPPEPSGTTIVLVPRGAGSSTAPSPAPEPKPSGTRPAAHPQRPNEPRTSPTFDPGDRPPPVMQSDRPGFVTLPPPETGPDILDK